MPTHQYFEIYCFANNGRYIRIAEVEMAATAGGADQCSGGTASANAGTANNAFDNNTGTFWDGGNDNVHQSWVRYNFGSATTVEEIRITAASGANWANAPWGFTVRGSNDGSTWINYECFVIPGGFGDGEQKAFAVGNTPLPTGVTNARGWRINVSTSTDVNAGQSEFQLAMTTGGSNICISGGGVATSKGCYNNNQANYSATRLVDDNLTTDHYVNGSTGVFGYIFPSPIGVPSEMRLGGTSLGFGSQNFDLQWTDNGVDWNNWLSYSGQTWTASELKTYSIGIATEGESSIILPLGRKISATSVPNSPLSIVSGDLKTLNYGFMGIPYCLVLSDPDTQDTEDYPAFMGVGIYFNPDGDPTPPPTPSSQISVFFIINN